MTNRDDIREASESLRKAVPQPQKTDPPAAAQVQPGAARQAVIDWRLAFIIPLAALFFFAIAFPPWETTISIQDAALVTRPAGHFFILATPQVSNPQSARLGMRISILPYLVQIALPLLGLIIIWAPSFATWARKKE